jgi:hypothetical protein
MGWFTKSEEKRAPVDLYKVDRKRLSATKDEYALVIHKAYEKLEENFMAGAGFQRQVSETVRQHYRRIEAGLQVDSTALYDFMEKVESARYSDRAMNEADRNVAILALRAVAYSLEPYRLPPQKRDVVLAEMAANREKTGSRPPKRPWVVAPALTPPESWLGLVESGVAGLDERAVEAFHNSLGPKKPIPAPLPDDTIEQIKTAMAGFRWAPLSGLMADQMAGPMSKGRLFIDRSLAKYMLEFGRRLKAAGKAGTEPPWDAQLKWLAAAQVLAVAEGRDFVVPDDLKVAILLEPAHKAFRVSGADALRVLDGVAVPAPEL